jgi:sec-independent protein translocase protein TatA
MFGLGMQELVIILVIVVVLFGSTRLPQIGEGVGKMITNFRKSMKDAGKGDDEDNGNKKEIPGA